MFNNGAISKSMNPNGGPNKWLKGGATGVDKLGTSMEVVGLFVKVSVLA